MTEERFTVNHTTRKGLLFVGTYGASDYLIYNDTAGVALLSNAQMNPSGTSITQLETTTKKELYRKLDQLIKRGYKVYSTFDQKGCFYVEDYKELKRVISALSK